MSDLSRQECEDFLYHEAQLLDNREFDQWLDLMTDDITYKVPRRVTLEKDSNLSDFSSDSYHYRETKQTLKSRIDRFDHDASWSENPPSRTRHFVSNVQPEYDDENMDGDTTVRSYLELRISQGDHSATETVTGERHDVLRTQNDEVKLAERTVLLDHTILAVSKLSVFL